ncbi:hypothetical protein MMC11_006961 [Xylographa trunciseda]|nr:hypothetical protein [Xylographa trunciseda]
MGVPEPPKPVKQRKTKKDRQGYSTADIEPVHDARKDRLYDPSISDINDVKGSSVARKHADKQNNPLRLPRKAEPQLVAIVKSNKAKSAHNHASVPLTAVPKSHLTIEQKRPKKNRQDYSAADVESVDDIRKHRPRDSFTTNLNDGKGSSMVSKHVGKHTDLLGLVCEEEVRSEAILKSSKAKSVQPHASLVPAGVPKSHNPSKQKKPKKDRLDASLEDIKAAPNEFNDCMCDLLNIPGYPMPDIEPCSKHKHMSKSREIVKRSTVIVDLEDSDSEHIHPSFTAVEVPKLPKLIQQKKVKKDRLKRPSASSKATPTLWETCMCDFVNPDNPLEQDWEYCSEGSLLLGVPCKALALFGGAVNPMGGDRESVGKGFLSVKKHLRSVLKDSKGVRGKKRKHEENGEKLELLVQGEHLSRRRKSSAAVASPPKRSGYDIRTLASDILRAAGRHPTLPPLNAHLVNRKARA